MTACIVGWGHTRFGRLDEMDLEGLIAAAAIQVPGASTAAVFNLGGMAVANYASILEPLR